MSERTLAVVSAGLSDPSSTRLLADRLARAAADALRDLGVGVTVESVDLRDHAHALTDNLLTGFAAQELEAVKQMVGGADGIVAVTPIFSASYNGLFKSFFDVLDEGAIVGVPVLMGATAGTARHSLALEHALRPLFAYLKAITVPTAVFAASEDWGAGGADGSLDGGLAARIGRAGRELAELVAAREPRAAIDPYGSVTSFEDMLKGA